MLSHRERRVLTRIERQLAAADPHPDNDFARLAHLTRPPRTAPDLPRLLRVAGLALLVPGALTAAAAVTVTGIGPATLTLAAHTGSGVRRSSPTSPVGRRQGWPGDG